MSIDNLLLLIKAISAKTTKNAPVDSQAQTANPFAASLFSNAFNPNTEKASFNNNNVVGNASLFNSNANLTFGSGQTKGGASIFNSTQQTNNRREHHVTNKPTNPSEQQGGVAELINLVKSLLEELKNNKNTNETQSVEAQQPKAKKKKGGGFFGFIKDAISTVAPMAMSMLGGGATGGMGNIASGLLGKFLG